MSRTESGIELRQGGADGAVEVFAYAACTGEAPAPGWEGFAEAGDGECAAEANFARNLRKEMGDTRRERSAEEIPRALEAERARGREEGRHAEREAQSAARTAEQAERKRQLARLVEGFALERDRYLEAVEREVVKLALAVAARILRREAQMDPLLLSGAVRVALGQLAGSTQVVLRVPAAEVELWKESIALIPNLPVKPAILAAEGMRLGDCVIESKLGTVDLGVRSQLGEIERGFFDSAGASREGSRNAAQTSAEPEGVQV